MTVENSLSSLEPKSLWHHFENILRIPRSSGSEDRIREHILVWAAQRGFSAHSAGAGNIVVKIPASAGLDGSPVIILQAHMDMVTEKEPNQKFDFSRDSIDARVEGDFVYASGTTLGADNGIGLTAAMALAEDEMVKHGPLELLFTSDEESGLTGAKQLRASTLQGRLLINLDSEDTAIYIGCAGAQDSKMTFPIERREASALTASYRVSVEGLTGGHSGVDIHKGHENAIKILAGAVSYLESSGQTIGLVSIDGGSSRNAIPRQSSALIRASPKTGPCLERLITEKEKELKSSVSLDADLRLGISRVPGTKREATALSSSDSKRILTALRDTPHGVLSMSNEIPGLVETSNNLAILRTSERTVEVFSLSRSSQPLAISSLTSELRGVCEAAGGEFSTLGGYPAWTPEPTSDLVNTASLSFCKIHGREPELRAIHAGLECAIIGSKIENVQMVSIGPEILGAHTPRERVKIKSVMSFYKLLESIIESLSCI